MRHTGDDPYQRGCQPARQLGSHLARPDRRSGPVSLPGAADGCPLAAWADSSLPRRVGRVVVLRALAAAASTRLGAAPEVSFAGAGASARRRSGPPAAGIQSAGCEAVLPRFVALAVCR